MNRSSLAGGWDMGVENSRWRERTVCVEENRFRSTKSFHMSSPKKPERRFKEREMLVRLG